MRPGIVQIHLLNLQALAEDRGSCLSAEEVSRAARFKFRENAERWVTCRVRLREILGQAIGRPPSEVSLVLAEFGKPRLAPPFDALYFNVAHAGASRAPPGRPGGRGFGTAPQGVRAGGM